MRRRMIPAAALRSILLILLCAAASPCRAQDGIFKVGVSLALTGPFAEYGLAVKNGIALAKRDNPARFRNVSFIFEDDQYLPKNTITALNKLIDADGINLFFVWGNEPALGAAPVSERRKIPTVLVAQHPQAGRGYKYVIRFINPASDYSSALHKSLLERGLKNLLVVKSEISFSNILLSELSRVQRPPETLKIVESFATTDTDFRPVILRLKAAHMDALGVYLSPPQVIQFFKQSNELGFHPVVFGTTIFENSAVIRGTGGQLDGSLFSHLHVEPAFEAHYLEAYPDEFQLAYAANAYDFANLVAELFGSGQPETPDGILAKLESAGERKGAEGSFRYTTSEEAGKYFEFKVVTKQISKGKVFELR